MQQTFSTLALDRSLYNLKGESLAFFKAQTGIQDEEALQNHILQVQAEAFAVYPLKIARFPAYEAILKLGRERKGALLLDLGCCFGNDARKAISDGFPQEHVIASDRYEDFWDLGHKLFKTTREAFPVCFLPGDIFDPAFLSPDATPEPSSEVSDLGPTPLLSQLSSLTPLQHRISVIHTSSFFHLFTKNQQRNLAHLLATLLSPLPGSIILGSHIANADTQECIAAGGLEKKSNDILIFGHCPTSWKNLWVGSDEVFRSQDVIVWATTKEQAPSDVASAGGDPTIKAYLMTWSITRV